MGWSKKGASVKPTTSAPDFAAAAGEIYVNTTDGTLYVSLGEGTWTTVTADSSYYAQAVTGAGSVASSGAASTEQGEIEVPTIASLFNAVGGYSDAGYVYSDDDGATWTPSNISGLTDYQSADVAYSNSNTYMTVQDSVGEQSVYSTQDATSWTLLDDTTRVYGSDDFIVRDYTVGTVTQSKTTGDWTTTNLSYGLSYRYVGMCGSNYVVVAEEGVYTSTDGITFTDTNAGALNIFAGACSGTNVTIAYLEDATTIGFKTYNGTWSTSTTTITLSEADEQYVTSMAYFNNQFRCVVLYSDYSASNIYVSSDADTWTTESGPGTYLPYKVFKSGQGTGFLSVADGSFNGWISKYDSGWQTAIQASTSSEIVQGLA